MLATTVADEVRKARAQKRDVGLEQSLQGALADSAAPIEAFLTARELSPSQPAERHELLLRITAAIDQLPDDQRDIVIRRDLHGATVAEIAAQLGCTPKAVAGLVLRGRRQLRKLLPSDS